jgi:hypothetical protein
MVHPFCAKFPVAPPAVAGIAVGADAAPVAAAAPSSEMSVLAKIATLFAGIGFIYYLGQRNGRIDGYVAGSEAGERLALETLIAHRAVHGTYPAPGDAE